MEQDETKDEELTTYDKGKELENEFALFMKRELNWKNARVGAHMAGKANVKGAAIDVIGERHDIRGRRFHLFSIAYLIIAGILLVLAYIWSSEGLDNDGEGFIIVAYILLAGSFVSIYFSNKFNKEHAWVECKNLKGKVNINQVDKSLRELNDYKVSGNKEYNFEYHYFVSANGYIENALKYAIDKGIICYQKDGNSFKRVGYWD